jgi:exonuclease SbcC
MRLVSLGISGFRGFPNPVLLDLDADAIIVAGVNGSGKTSLFDAILWVLCGSIDRLNDDTGVVISKYSKTGEARVEIVLKDDAGRRATVVRRYDESMHLSVQQNDASPVTGIPAQAALIELLWPDAKSAPDEQVALARSLTRATYLQQDSVRRFVEADDEQTRFQVVSELVGAGRIGELQRLMESSKKSWTQATSSLTKDLAPLSTQRNALAERLKRLGQVSDAASIATEFRTWSDAVANVLAGSGATPPPGRHVEQTTAGLERAIAELLAREQAEGRRIGALGRLSAHLVNQPPDAPDLAPFEASLAAAQAAATQVSEKLRAAQGRAAAVRRAQVELAERDASLRALAQLALENLGDTCPVCGQDYERDVTRSRLQDLVAAVATPPATAPVGQDVVTVAIELEAAERVLAAAQAALRNGQIAAEQEAQWRSGLLPLIEEVGLRDGATLVEDLALLREEGDNTLESIRQLRAEGERLSLGLARAAEVAQRSDVEQQLESLDASIAKRRAAIEARAATGELAGQVITALRAAGNSVVTKQLEGIEPLLQRIFATVDPHPTLRIVNFLTKSFRGHGQLWTTLDDVQGEVSVQDPSLVLSSSQLNVLAVAIHLALNLAIPTLPLQVVALDDPLQSLDTVNLLGLADLLRRVKATRQVIVSTHDEKLADLLERKLRPVGLHERTLRIDLRGWTPDGPSIETTQVPQDVSPLRLVATA